VIVFASLVITAAALVNRRDVGAGILLEQRANAAAPASLLSPLGLFCSVQRPPGPRPDRRATALLATGLIVFRQWSLVLPV
jgi:hypothetical protein